MNKITLEDLSNYRRKGAGNLVDAYEQQQQRIAELEDKHEKAYVKWQSKYQQLKDGLTLTPCYECGTPVHELSPRSRCCMCEYNRAKFNEEENDRLRGQSHE